LNALYGKKFGDMGFWISYPEAYGGLNLFYTVIFLEELQKIKSSGFLLQCGLMPT
jgi:alkylation response protein AidB-like acyl-CoA dehydrogenase